MTNQGHRCQHLSCRIIWNVLLPPNSHPHPHLRLRPVLLDLTVTLTAAGRQTGRGAQAGYQPRVLAFQVRCQHVQRPAICQSVLPPVQPVKPT